MEGALGGLMRQRGALLLAVVLWPALLRGGAGLPTAEEVHSTLERVLARPEFQPAQRSWLGRLWDWLREKILEAVIWFWSRLGQGLAHPLVANLVLAALIVLLVLFLAHLLRSLLLLRRPSRPDPEGLARVAALSPEPCLAAAAALAREGRFLEAARQLYRGVLLWLDASGRSRYQESKTGGEYHRDLWGSPLSGPFGALLSAFYPMAYGGRAASREAYQRMRQAAAEIGVPE